ncbi:MAG: hypothetical protein IJD04_04795 [Desulfovibrionaceae bacterium]|nr:hypothetical protein [Desulfovibrionaceae bacterium]
MKDTYLLVADPAGKEAGKDMALFRLDDDAVREFHSVESSSIDREYAPLQLYACDRALLIETASKTARLASEDAGPAVYTLMLVSNPFPRQSVILITAQYNREEYRGGAGMFIAPFLEMLRKEPVDGLAAAARRLLRELSEANALIREDGTRMTYDDIMDLLL